MQHFACLIYKKETCILPSWQHNETSERICEISAGLPQDRQGKLQIQLEDILLLVILGRLGKCITRPDIIRFGERNLKRFRSLGILLDGVPSEPTLCRIFKHIDDEAMSERMSEFTSTFHDELVGCAGDILCIDGKAMRGRYLKTDAPPTSYPPIPLKEVSPLPRTCVKKKATR